MKRLSIGLQGKVTTAISILVLAVLIGMVSLNIYHQQTQLRGQFVSSTGGLTEAVYNGMLHPMSIGDSDSIQQQMKDLGKNRDALQIIVFGVDKKIAYSTEKEKIQADLAKLVSSPELQKAIGQLLTNGKMDEAGYEEIIEGKRYLSVLRPLMNESRCHHCHGASHSVLGGVMVQQNSEGMYAGLKSLRNINILVGFVGALVIILFLYFLITRLATLPLQRVSDCLIGISEQVSTSANQLSEAGQQLAEGASEQAASVEETSSSLEEMSSMARQNASNAKETNSIMRDVLAITSRADVSMAQLTGSMDEISKASEQTQKIIKTIDEIAFQTNLLALNAAVEAARAGEAGSGFAVVADEVRNLAMRAADAARNTANLIEDTMKKVRDGSGVVEKTSKDFADVASGISKMDKLVGEIVVASEEQTIGIEQINKAVGEMDKVVQGNAGNAEELASASEEMNSQAYQMKGVVGDLIHVVRGSKGSMMDGKENLQPSDKEPRKNAVSMARQIPYEPGYGNAKDKGAERVSSEREYGKAPRLRPLTLNTDEFRDF